MNSLHGKKGYKLYWDKENMNLIQKSHNGKNLKNIYYFYGCGKTKKSIILKERNKKSWIFKFMKFFSKEQMEVLGVRF